MPDTRIATFNILHGMTPTDAQVDPGRLAGAAAELDADVLAVQEVDDQQARSARADQTRLVGESLGAAWFRFVPTVVGTPGERSHQPATADPLTAAVTAAPTDAEPAAPHRVGGQQPRYGIALVSRFPVLQWRVRRFGAAPTRAPLVVPTTGGLRLAFVRDEPRAAVAAVIDGPGGRFTVIGTHLSFVPGFNLAQLHRIARWAADLPRPLFLVGDLNLPGPVPGRLTAMTSLVRAATYPAWRPRVQLDHLLAAGLRPEQVRGEHVWSLPVSDHLAIGVDVRL